MLFLHCFTYILPKVAYPCNLNTGIWQGIDCTYMHWELTSSQHDDMVNLWHIIMGFWMPSWPLVIVPFKLLCFSGWGQWGGATRMSVFTSGGVGICWWRGWGCWPQIGSATTCRFLILLQSWQQWWWKVQEATWQAWLWSCLWSAVIGESTETTKQGICPNHPFWEDLPHSNVFSCITLDLLHQLHKGVFKDHVVKWATECLEGGEKEIDLMILNHKATTYGISRKASPLSHSGLILNTRTWRKSSLVFLQALPSLVSYVLSILPLTSFTMPTSNPTHWTLFANLTLLICQGHD